MSFLRQKQGIKIPADGTMIANRSMSSPPLTKGANSSPRNDRLPRLANGEERPVRSPVHAMQQELIRADAAREPAAAPESPAPGWVRVGFPLAASILLWAVIVWFIVKVW